MLIWRLPKNIQLGIHVQLTGHSGPSRNANEAVLFCHSATYLLANNDPRHLLNVLRYAIKGLLDANQVIDMLPCIGREGLTTILGVGNYLRRTILLKKLHQRY